MNDKPYTSMLIQDIPLDLIDWEGQSVRDSVDDDHVVELAMSIAKKGLLQPIVVEKKDNGRYQGCAGFHRSAAFFRLGRVNIPANIRADDYTPVKALALIENIIRRDMSLDEEVKAVTYLNTEEQLSPSQICDLLGKSRAWVDRRLMIPGLPENVKKELLAGVISIGVAEIIGSVAQDSIRGILLNQVISAKLTQRQTEELAKLYLETDSIPDAINEGVKVSQSLLSPQKTFRECVSCHEIYELELLQYAPVCYRCMTFFSTNKVEHEDKREVKDNAG
jgi:ParB family chromosome partitioning protein